MWVEQIDDKKFKYVERYIDPLTEKKKKVSVTLSSGSRQAWNQANLILNKKIQDKLEVTEVLPVTFGELKDKWDEKYKPTVKASSYKTTKVYISLISEYINDDVLVKNITSNMIQDMLDHYYFEKDLSYNYVNHLKTFIGMIFKFANKRYGLEYNPVSSVSLSKKPKTKEDIQKEKDGYLTKEDILLLSEEQEKNYQQNRYSLITRFLFLTGLRYGELAALTESDYAGKKITISGTYDYDNGIKTTTKNSGSYRTIELPDNAIDILDVLIKENSLINSDIVNPSKYIFISKNGNPLSIQAYNLSLRTCASSVGIDKKVSSHMLRHSHISLLTELGIPLKAIMDRVGHEDSKTTLKIYTHTTKNMQSHLIEKLSEIEI
ncbi:tyrosine-type recombinase/integrase [Enterococcus rotai]|uniref:tyrosine-type recombinase/integrase n=1 Tax=Enterococcus rotai TaxID=118060 RepID=UPI0035C72026